MSGMTPQHPAAPEADANGLTEAEWEVEAWAGHGLRCMETPCVACQIEMVLDDHRAMVSGDDDGWHVICSCGHDELGMGVNAHLATHLSALLDRVRRDEGEKVLREAADDFNLGALSFKEGGWGSNPADQQAISIMATTLKWLRDRAASVGRREGL